MAQDTVRKREITLPVTIELERWCWSDNFYVWLGMQILEVVWLDADGRYRITNGRNVHFWGDTPEQAVSAWIAGRHE
jgi:hypothetical protein